MSEAMAKLSALDQAIESMRKALEVMVELQHPHTAERIRLALSSAYGARRIESNRAYADRPRKPPPKNVKRAVVSRLAWRECGALRRILSKVDGFEQDCAAAEHTDTGIAWEVFHEIKKLAEDVVEERRRA